MRLRLTNFFRLSLAALFLTATVVVYFSLSQLQSQLQKQFRQNAERQAKILETLYRHTLQLGDYHEVQSISRQFMENKQVDFLQIKNQYEEIIFESGDSSLSKDASRINLGRKIENPIDPQNSLGTLNVVFSSSEINRLFRSHALIIVLTLLFVLTTIVLGVQAFQAYLNRYFRHLKSGFEAALKDEGPENRSYFISEFAEVLQFLRRTARRLSNLRKKEREQAAVVAVGRVASQVAHDIKSPVSTLEIAKNSLPKNSEERELIEACVKRIKAICSDLKDIWQSNKESSSADLLEDSFDPVQLCREIIEEKRLQFERDRRVSITLESPGVAIGFRRFAIGRTELGRVISNLISNAYESFSKNGKIVVEILEKESIVVFRVRDNGRGIPSSVLKKIGRLGVTIKKQGGTGLGLFHAKDVARRAGGSLKVFSLPGKGTTISVSIPIKPLETESVLFSERAERIG